MTTPNDPGNAAMVRHLAGQFFEEWETRQGKKPASWQSWSGLVLSVLGIAYVAGALVGDIAEANTRSIENRQKIEALERQNSSIEKGVAALNAKMDILMEERKR